MDQLFDSYKYLEINLLKYYLALLSKLIENYFFINSTKVRDKSSKFNIYLLSYFIYFDNNENNNIKIIFYAFLIVVEATNYQHCFKR